MATKEKQGIRDCFTNTSEYNQLEFIIEQKIRQMVNTAALVRVDSCTSKGSDSAAGEVSATPMVAQTDADGNALPMASIPRMPHFRVQGGKAALIIDPVPGDLGVAVFCKADSSTIKTGTKEPQRPGSYRSFDQADGMLVGTISNQKPTVWIELKQDETIIIHAPKGCRVETDETVEIEAGNAVNIKAANIIRLDTPIVEVSGNLTATGENGGASVEITGTLHSTGDQIADKVSQLHHQHEGVWGGGDISGEPVK